MARYNEGNQLLQKMIKEMNSLKSNIFERDSMTSTVKHFDDKLYLDCLYVRLKTNNIGHAFILGSTLNGYLGVHTGADGYQILLGDYRGAQDYVERVISPGYTFKDYFRDTTFDNSSTCDWNVSYFKARFAVGEVLKTLAIFLNDESITHVTVQNELYSAGNTTTIQATGGGHRFDVY